MRHAEQTTWRLIDIALVLVYSAIGVVILALGWALLSPLLNLGDPQTLLESNPVLVSGIFGILVYGVVLVAIYLQIVRGRHTSWRNIGFRAPPALPLALAPVIAVGQLTTVALLNALVLALTGQFENPQIEAISGAGGFSWPNFILMLLLAGVAAPIVEETLFRGVLYGWLRIRVPIVLAVVVSAALFAGVHFIPILLPALFVVGIILAVVYEWSQSLWVPILLHSIQNSVAVIVIFAALAMGVPLE
ncbi:MAG: hypothetical protein AVDCRST_MAG93-6286 [uncultured Chloroflexia bacterium]|uniref:CAAX prenyl protease 2/Lysostaphin resistance protein A-like domain-containing protein n=1 Tax=uncultured Chloroflexia bacterium TaxID=1672391 RepID=A0A6J4LHH8_9CHLR|nr:MAG: hypothetical protein AVDCRST_MAG93-6286 [uncultured Chloroflexia bacterium]